MNLTKNKKIKRPTWSAIARHIGEVEGKRISRERVRMVGIKALQKLARELIEEPIIRDWAEEQGIEIKK